jgi:hypothetical protein
MTARLITKLYYGGSNTPPFAGPSGGPPYPGGTAWREICINSAFLWR